MKYDETSIKVLSYESASEAFPWLKIEELSRLYSVPLECVQRGFEASFQLGISPDFYINKYILKQDLPINKELLEVYKELKQPKRENRCKQNLNQDLDQQNNNVN